jgi:hypothetical protein
MDEVNGQQILHHLYVTIKINNLHNDTWQFNLGNGEEPIDVLIGAILLTTFQIQIKEPLLNDKDVFAWDYKELKGIPKEDKKIVG